MAELADALDLGSSGRPCRFESCYPHAPRPSGSDGLISFCLTLSVLFFTRHLQRLPDPPDLFFMSRVVKGRLQIKGQVLQRRMAHHV